MSGYGLIGTGTEYRQQAAAGLQAAAREETNRDIDNKQIKAQRHAANQQLGAAGGAAAGAMIGGPIGALIGGIAGGLLGGSF